MGRKRKALSGLEGLLEIVGFGVMAGTVGAGTYCCVYLFVQDAVKDEDERSLKTVDNREDVREHDGLLVDKRQTKRPRQAE